MPLPEAQRIAFETVARYDPDANVWEEEGWRTFVLERAPWLTGSHVAAAQARPDDSARALGGWLVQLTFTADGAALFEQATARFVKRRFAIVVDDVVKSAPVIQGRIEGGTGVITMGAGSLEEQATNAKSLEAVLQSGSLPVPLLLQSEDRVDTHLPRVAWGALVAFAGLLLLAQLVFALRLALRRAPPLLTP